MPPIKTTVYLEETDYRRLQRTARRLGQPTAELIREAVHEYAVHRAVTELPASLGIGATAAGDLSERAEELLRGLGEERRRPAAPVPSRRRAGVKK